MEQLASVLEQVFAIPDSEELAIAWAAGFGLPILSFVIGWSYGAIINMIK
jgi:hypothetical protein